MTTDAVDNLAKRAEFQTRATHLSNDLANCLAEKMLKAYDALTEKERLDLDTADRPWFLPRAIALIEVDKAAQNCFMVEAIKGLIPRIKRILNKRYY
jgi:hypothetical protein